MNNSEEIRQKWIEALRSGDYKQGLFTLQYKVGGDNYYCCLGVLCDLHARSTGDGHWEERPQHSERLVQDYHMHDSVSSRTIPLRVSIWAGLSVETTDKLTALNDYDRANFNTIADHIEQHL